MSDEPQPLPPVTAADIAYARAQMSVPGSDVPDPEFDAAAAFVLNENAELYQRLAAGDRTPPPARFDPDAPCVKCGSRDIGLEYCRYDHEHSTAAYLAPAMEHLHCKCRRCSYAWQALPLDTPGVSERAILDLARGPLG